MLRRYDSSPLRLLRNEVDKLFEQSFYNTQTTQWMPEVDIVESENELILNAEMAGVSPEDIDLSIENNELTIKGEKKLSQNTDGKSFHRIERRYGAFTRSFRLPQTVDTENIQAKFENGLLVVSLTKKENVKARKINILTTDTSPKEIAKSATA